MPEPDDPLTLDRLLVEPYLVPPVMLELAPRWHWYDRLPRPLRLRCYRLIARRHRCTARLLGPDETPMESARIEYR